MLRLLSALFATLLLLGACAEPVTPALDVTPAALTIVSGQTLQLSVTRRFTGNSVEDVTAHVSYSTSAKLVVDVNASTGLLTAGDQAGTALVRIVDPSSDAVATTTITVLPAAILSIDIDPSPATVLDKGATRNFAASARLSNGTTKDVTGQVLWTVTNESIASVGNTTLDKGLVTALAGGSTQVSATDAQTGVQGQTTLFVTGDLPALVAIQVSPNPATVTAGKTVQLTALGVLSDGSTRDLTKTVTWISNGTAFATIDTVGLATGLLLGEVTITAIGPTPSTSIRGSASLTITP